ARFRVYGLVAPIFPANVYAPVDLASVFSGARVVYTSDQHFGVGPNLLLPGRGTYFTGYMPVRSLKLLLL
ncbi:Allantoicase, partial [Ceratobasidium sp. 428]